MSSEDCVTVNILISLKGKPRMTVPGEHGNGQDHGRDSNIGVSVFGGILA